MHVNQVVNVANGEEEKIRQKFAEELQKKLTSKNIMFGVGALLALIVILPLAWLIAQAVAVLAGAGVLLVAGAVAWLKLPRWLQKIKNREIVLMMEEQNKQLARLKAEARKNPIEQAQNEYLRRSRQYTAFKTALEQIGGQVAAFRSKLEKTARDKPRYDLTQERDALAKMDLFYNSRKERLAKAFSSLELFKEKIEEAQTKWEFQLQANAAIRAMNATDQEAKMAEILTAVAFDEVQTQFDTVFARLDVDAAEITASKALEFAPNMVIDVSAIRIDQPELVPAQLATTAQGR